MLIQNSGSAASAPGLTSNSAPAAAASPQPNTAPVDLPQAASQAASVQAQAASAQKPAPSAAQVQSAVDNINRAMRQSNANVEFSIDQDTNQMIIRVVESGTGQVIRQFPSEEILAIAKSLDTLQGLLVKQKV